MRIRTIKPEFWRSDDIAAMSREERLLFIGIWSYVDDNGVGVDDYRLVAAALFPLDDDQNETREFVRASLNSLSSRSLIARYEVDGKSYLHVSTWRSHQRVVNPNKPRYPLPPGEAEPSTSGNVEETESLARDTRETSRSLPTVVVEQSSKRTRAAALVEPEGFAEFYAEYPRKRERKKAAVAYRSALKTGATPERLVQAAKSYAMANRGKKLEYVKYPASWLNAGAYDDEVEPVGLALVPGGTHVADPANGVYWEQ